MVGIESGIDAAAHTERVRENKAKQEGNICILTYSSSPYGAESV